MINGANADLAQDAGASIAASERQALATRLKQIVVGLTLLGLLLGVGLWYAITARSQAAVNADLVYSARAGDLPGVEQALRQGAAINGTADPAPMPIWYRWFHIPAPDQGLVVWERGRTALIWVASASPEHVEMLKTLLARGADVNHRSVTGDTALNAATRSGNLATVRLLLEHGANPNVPDIQNAMALDNAVLFHQVQIAELLLAHGARLSPTQIAQEMQAAIRWKDPKMIALLKRAGAK